MLLCSMLLCTSLAVAARDSIRLGMQLEPPALDPTMTASASAGEITYCNVLEGLTVIDGEGHLQPRLATSWVRSEDGLRYDFVLRTDARFHDGKPFNAQIAAYSLKRLIAPDSENPQKKWFEKIQSVESVGMDKLVVRLTQPDALFPVALALPAAVIVHPDTAGSNATHPIGTGPFHFAGWTHGKMVALERNDKYWGKAPALRSAQFLFMRTTAETENMLSEGLVDGMVSVTRITNRFMLRPDYRMSMRKLESKMILAINNARAPFNDLRVRRALAHAINREKILTIYGTQFSPEPIGSHYSPSRPGYVNLVDYYPYDPARARALLAEAGVVPGTSVTLTIPPTDYGRFGGLKVASDLEAVGLRVELLEVDWKQWMSDVFERKDYALTLIMHVEPMDLNIYARDDYYFNYDNAAFKEIWQRVLSARDDPELNTLLGEAQRRITEDAVNVFLFMRPEQNFMQRDLAGFWEKSPIPSVVLEDVYWKPTHK